MKNTNTDKYADDTHEYGKDINADLKHFEKLIYAWTYRAVRMLNPNYFETDNGTVLSFGPLGSTFDDIKQEMTISAWTAFNIFNNKKLKTSFENPASFYIALLNKELKQKAFLILRQSRTERAGKKIQFLTGPQADNIFYGVNVDWSN